MSNLNLKIETQDVILAALVSAALAAQDDNKIELADSIRNEATKLAKRWKIKDVHGLPNTWDRGKRIPDYR